MKEDASQQRAILTAALIQGTMDAADKTALLDAQSDQAATVALFNSSATSAQRQLFQNSVFGSLFPHASSEEQRALSMGTSLKKDSTTPDAWYGAMSNEIDYQLGPVERDLASQVSVRASALHRDSIITGLGVSALLVLLLLSFAALPVIALVRRFVVRRSTKDLSPLGDAGEGMDSQGAART
jgi:hypothetical protein